MKEEDKEGNGNISIWGRNVFMGYLGDKRGTVTWTDCYGWLHTGDLGFLDVDNFLYIRGSVKGEQNRAGARGAARDSGAGCTRRDPARAGVRR